MFSYFKSEILIITKRQYNEYLWLKMTKHPLTFIPQCLVILSHLYWRFFFLIPEVVCFWCRCLLCHQEWMPSTWPPSTGRFRSSYAASLREREMYIYVYINTYMHTYMHTYIHTYIYTQYIIIITYVCIYIYICTHTKIILHIFIYIYM